MGPTSPLDANDLTADAQSVRASAMIGATGSTTTTIFDELDELYHKLEVKGREVAMIETVGTPLTQSIWALAPDELVRHLGYAVARGAGGAYGLADVPVRPSASNAGVSVVQAQKGDGTLIGFESAVFKAAVTEFVPGLAVPGLVVARDGTNYHVQLAIDQGTTKILRVLISSPGLLDAQQVTLDEALDVLGLVARPLAYEVQQVDAVARAALAAARGAAKMTLASCLAPLANTLRLLSGPAGRQVLGDDNQVSLADLATFATGMAATGNPTSGQLVTLALGTAKDSDGGNALIDLRYSSGYFDGQRLTRFIFLEIGTRDSRSERRESLSALALSRPARRGPAFSDFSFTYRFLPVLI